MNDFMHCYRRVDADIMKLCISDMDHGRKLICSSYVHLPSINKISQSLRLSDSVLCKRGLYLWSTGAISRF